MGWKADDECGTLCAGICCGWASGKGVCCCGRGANGGGKEPVEDGPGRFAGACGGPDMVLGAYEGPIWAEARRATSMPSGAGPMPGMVLTSGGGDSCGRVSAYMAAKCRDVSV